MGREEQVRAGIQGILSSKEFSPAGKEEGILQTLTDMLKALSEWLKSLISRFNIPTSGMSINNRPLSEAEALVLKAAGILLMVLFIAAIFYFIKRNMRAAKRLKQEEEAVLLSEIKDYRQVEGRALSLYEKGDFKQAVRFLYMALLIRFNEMSLIRIHKSKTNRQYLNELFHGGYGDFEVVQAFTGFYNESWYGNKKVDRGHCDYWFEKYNSLLKEGV